MESPDPLLAQAVFERIKAELRKLIVGQDEIVRLLLVSLFAKGHCLLIGVPGLAKTLLVKSLAEVIGLPFKRIQFTPDLMPADIIGSELLKDMGGRLEFEFQYGPVFTSLLLADEINRTPPKTQSALLEAMQERAVTVAGHSRVLPDPFLVVATQNPIEQEGTYPLPEAQLDRFMFSLNLDYPGKDEEMELVRRTTLGDLPLLASVVTREEILDVQRLVRAVPVSDHVLEYAVEMARATRSATSTSAAAKDYLEWGAGPRASQYLILGAKALALMDGRAAPETSDVREVALPVLQHRVVTSYRATGAGLKARDVLGKLLETVKEPDYR
ncbi:MAG TPA: MoxR family ATPase [Chthoniobacteraceae bacterium]|jgi:MoxR-like ATPase|nr:MoxR family ATPase [Chthoniobacteraceae bacterium]